MWSWDITKLHGPAKWTYYYLYVILDIYSRYAVGWMVATRESAALAEKLIAATCAKQGIGRDQLTIHADRGSSMTSKPVAFLLADLGVTQSHSRPHVSNDNPYSEAQFKTLKYRPGFPARFGSIEAARAHCQAFFAWYNHEHRHSGLGLHTAADVHHGTRRRRPRPPRPRPRPPPTASTLSASSAGPPPRQNCPPPPGSTRPRERKPPLSNNPRTGASFRLTGSVASTWSGSRCRLCCRCEEGGECAVTAAVPAPSGTSPCSPPCTRTAHGASPAVSACHPAYWAVRAQWPDK